jgi:hypothetical protein
MAIEDTSANLLDYYIRHPDAPGAQEYIAEHDPSYNQPGGAGFQENLARIMAEQAAAEEAAAAAAAAEANQPGGSGFQDNLARIMDEAGSYDREQITGDMTNDELYDAQFSNLAGQSNAFQNQQQLSQALRAQAADDRQNAEPFDFNTDKSFDWYNTKEDGTTGLKTAVAAGAPSGDNPDAIASQWQFAPGVTAGMTNREAFGAVRNQLTQSTQEALGKGFNDLTNPESVEGGGRVQYASGDNMDPNFYHSNRSPSTGPNYTDALTELVNTLYNRTDLTTPVGGGPSASPGYALPVQAA